MNQMIACCGLVCGTCDAFLATQNNDEKKKAAVARLWSEQFHMDLKPEDVACDGCQSEGSRLSGYCRICQLRVCARGKGIANCALCDDYACEKLKKFHAMAPEARERLNDLRGKA
jgi:hypothetical protein